MSRRSALRDLTPWPPLGLWVSDGTAAGTKRLSDGAIEDPREIAKPVVFNDELAPACPRLLFQNWDRDHGFELWGLEAE